MSAIVKKESFYPSSSGEGKIYSCQWKAEGEPSALLEISHGMAEHMGRYDAFASYLAARGILVFGNDHAGHGQSASPDQYGFFAKKDGWEHVLRDMDALIEAERAQYPSLPVFLLGHSMGSMLARCYVNRHGEKLAGAIFSGTNGPSPTAKMGRLLAGAFSLLRTGHYNSKLLNDMSHAGFTKRIENPRSEYAWLSRDPEIEDAYNAAKDCGFPFTSRAFYDMTGGIVEISSPKWAEKVPKALPIYLFSGDQDPVGDYGQGVKTVFNWLKQAGQADVQLKLYENGRHEMHNETNRFDVYEDVYRWIKKHIQ